MRTQVAEVLDLIRPAVQADGGDVELVDVDADGVVSVRFHGACVGCPSSAMTLQAGIEQRLKDRIEAVAAVVAVD
ncbi:MAG: NifU family protein [Phycisphaerales bacterium]|nr:NifU family protein [Phycisphaerales bacterium]